MTTITVFDWDWMYILVAAFYNCQILKTNQIEWTSTKNMNYENWKLYGTQVGLTFISVFFVRN